jgi:DNA-binding NarL/FixJ family response regulator
MSAGRTGKARRRPSARRDGLSRKGDEQAGIGDDALRDIAILRMEGFTVDEIAGRLGSTRRTVERRLHVIRKTWEQS